MDGETHPEGRCTMSTTLRQPSSASRERAAEVAAEADSPWHDARYQAYQLLRLGLTIAPIAFGLDKFTNLMVDWPQYLAPWIADLTPGSPQSFMYFVGVVEIVAGLVVFVKPRYGG